jgi:hypothetical protein
VFRRPRKGTLNNATSQELACCPPDLSSDHWHVLQFCRGMSKRQRGKRYSREQTRDGMSSPAGFEGVRLSEAVRAWLLGGFRVSVGSRTITQDTADHQTRYGDQVTWIAPFIGQPTQDG